MKHLVVVLTEPNVGRDEEYNEYYENRHIDEVLESTGWLSGQRFKLSEEIGAKCPLPYLAVYEAEAENAAAVLKTLNDTRGQREQSDSLNKKTAGVWVYAPTGARHDAN